MISMLDDVEERLKQDPLVYAAVKAVLVGVSAKPPPSDCVVIGVVEEPTSLSDGSTASAVNVVYDFLANLREVLRNVDVGEAVCASMSRLLATGQLPILVVLPNGSFAVVGATRVPAQSCGQPN